MIISFTLQDIASTSIDSLLFHTNWDDDKGNLITGTVYAQFKNGMEYEYTGVFLHAFLEVAGAKSIGKMFRDIVVNGNYPYRHVRSRLVEKVADEAGV